ncbi:MAG: helix-turn-helix transcriptional regulator [Terrimicrobiaceae bacterium]|nr:helix-turn-helix transcriptional regulator [Terrimicrobiaceae bacterium]
MKSYRHPPLRSVSLPVVMQALSDPWRLKIVRQLLGAGEAEFTCSDFPMDVSKATRSHHFQVLREAGLVRMRSAGNTCRTSLRREEFEKRFPGLLAVVAASGSRP